MGKRGKRQGSPRETRLLPLFLAALIPLAGNPSVAAASAAFNDGRISLGGSKGAPGALPPLSWMTRPWNSVAPPAASIFAATAFPPAAVLPSFPSARFENPFVLTAPEAAPASIEPGSSISPNHGAPVAQAAPDSPIGSLAAAAGHGAPTIDFDGAGILPKATQPRDLPYADRRSFREVLVDGTQGVGPSQGLGNFWIAKLKSRRDGAHFPALEHQLAYVDKLLENVPWAAKLRAAFAAIRDSGANAREKESAFDRLGIKTVKTLRELVVRDDPAAFHRLDSTYMVDLHSYNKPLDEAEFARLKKDLHITEVWLLGAWEIGEKGKWGTGHGSLYPVRAYHGHPAIGGDDGLRTIVDNARAAGLRVLFDDVPNNTSLDSDIIWHHPEATLHILPPQHLSDEEIMASVPREPGDNKKPVYYLAETGNYLFPDGTRGYARILVHHPIANDGVMYIDMAQLAILRPATRQLLINRLIRHFKNGADTVRLDMADELIPWKFYERWKKNLHQELEQLPAGWMRDAQEALLRQLDEEWRTLGEADYLKDAVAAVKQARPDAHIVAESHGSENELSRTGVGAFLNKIGSYDAAASRDPERLRSALWDVIIRQFVGGALPQNMIGNQDGDTGNAVDRFGDFLEPAIVTLLLLRPILLFNGVEQCVEQALNIILFGPSDDRSKAIPWDVKALLNWLNANPIRQAFLKNVLAVGGENADVFVNGIKEVLKPKLVDPALPTPIVAYTARSPETGKTFLIAANWSEHDASGVFPLHNPLLKDFGAFVPQENRPYDLRELAHPHAPLISYHGADLLKDGLYIKLPARGMHIFEILEKE